MAPVVGIKRKRAKASNATRTSLIDIEAPAQEQRPRKKRGRRSNSEFAEQGPHKAHVDGELVAEYQHLAPVTRGVARHTIDTKWASLPTSAVDQISILLNAVERSVVMRLQDERKRTQASTAVQMVARRLQRKLSRGQPFPPATRPLPEEDFNLEKVLDSSRALEAQLTPLTHSIELLKAEIAKEEALLEAETAALDALEANAKAEASRRKRTTKTLHDILRDETDVKMENMVDENVSIDRKSIQELSKISADEELAPVVNQLYNHLDSIQGNVNQVENLASAMGGSRAALQEVLCKHLGTTRYAEIVLG